MLGVEDLALIPCHRISRVIGAGWQLAGSHGASDQEPALDVMLLCEEAGSTSLDCAKTHTREEPIGQLLLRHRCPLRIATPPGVQIHSMLPPRPDSLPTLARVRTKATVLVHAA